MASDVTTFDVARARDETPGCRHVLHLNNAGSSLPPRPVLDAQIDWLRQEAVTGGYELATRRQDDRQRTYQEIAALVGADPGEIAVVENATFAWHQAFWSLPLAPGDRILTCEVEYATNFLSFLQAVDRRGVSIEVVPSDEHGQLSVEALADMLDGGPAGGRPGGRRVGLVALTHVPTNGGVVNPAEGVGRLTRAAGVPFLLDACQSIGQMPLDVDAIGCDMLAATGRKWLRAPRGTGFLYVRSTLLDQLEPAFLDLLGATWVEADRYELRPDARRFENWEANLAGVIGLGEAVAYARGWGLDAIGERVTGLAAALREQLAAIDGVEVRDLGERPSGIVTFTRAGVEAEALRDALADQGINVSVTHGASTLLDTQRRQLPDLVRASVHYYNDDDELDRFCHAVAAV
jgi:cysteine desulfurase / selenocysteine lyase